MECLMGFHVLFVLKKCIFVLLIMLIYAKYYHGVCFVILFSYFCSENNQISEKMLSKKGRTNEIIILQTKDL